MKVAKIEISIEKQPEYAVDGGFKRGSRVDSSRFEEENITYTSFIGLLSE
jgi:hypothetical protein